jgi:hypothetical protein
VGSFARRMTLGIGMVLIIGMMALTAFEILYRLQVVDTYAPELRAYNPASYLDSSDERPTVLLMGDSFTAGAETYPALLRIALPGARFVNGAIPGTGIVQTAIVAGERFARFHPKVFVYQIFVGNDLFDISYPINWMRSSVIRNLYWVVAQQFRSVGFVNYRLGQWGSQRRVAGTAWDTTAIDAPFSPASYAPRSRIYLRADPKLIEESALVRGKRADDFAALIKRLHALLARCAAGQCTAFLVVIPDCAQVTQQYLRNSRALGAVISDPPAVQNAEYPFVVQLRTAMLDVPNVTVLNPIEVLRKSEQAGVPVYHSNDGHLNPAGQRALTQFLIPHLASSLRLVEHDSTQAR